MSNNRNSSNTMGQSTGEPLMLRMLHPTSGRQGFNEVSNPAVYPSQLAIDPRLASMINMQTQRAISASGVPITNPYQYHGSQTFPPPMYGYGMYQPYRFF